MTSARKSPKLWFRLYSEAVDDEKLRLLAFEDRWHFVAILCCKAQGILDEDSSEALIRRKVAVKLGLDGGSLDEAIKRLADVGLIDKTTMNPIAWDERQFETDSSKERTRAYRERKKQSCDGHVTSQKRHGDVTVTVQETEAEAEKEVNLKERKKEKERKVAISFDTFLAQCKAKGEKAISDYKPIMDFTQKIGLPMDFTVLCWEEFKRRHSKGGLAEGKRYADWRRAFRNCLEGNWYRLWYFDQGSGKYVLTSNGVAADRATA